MLPGVRGMSHDSIPAGSIASIKVMGNPCAIAVGVVLFDPGSVNTGGEGRVLQVKHWYGDGLWEAGGREVPNEGFVDGYVQPIEGVEAGGGEEGEEGGEGEEGERGNAERTGGEKEDREEEGEEEGEGEVVDRDAMDALLEKSFFQAIKTTVKEKDLPMESSVFYLQHMRPARLIGTRYTPLKRSHTVYSCVRARHLKQRPSLVLLTGGDILLVFLSSSRYMFLPIAEKAGRAHLQAPACP